MANRTPDNSGVVLGAFQGEANPAPNTILGAAALALCEFLVEIDAKAVLQAAPT